MGLEIAGKGMVHKGFCHQQILAEEAEDAKKQALADAASAPAEFACGICGKEIEDGADYYTMPEEEGGRHVHVGRRHGLAGGAGGVGFGGGASEAPSGCIDGRGGGGELGAGLAGGGLGDDGDAAEQEVLENVRESVLLL